MVQTKEERNAKQNENRARHRANGKCSCGKKRHMNSKQCKTCYDNRKIRCDKFVAKAVAKGLCRCGKNPPDPGVKECSDCRAGHKRNKQKNWVNVKIRDCKNADRYAKVPRLYNEEDYLTGPDILALREELQNKCYYCKIVMQTEHMQGKDHDDGLTIERFDNRLAHVKINCTLACWGCNINKIGHLSEFKPETQAKLRVWLENRKTENAVRAVLDEIITNVAKLSTNSICVGVCE